MIEKKGPIRDSFDSNGRLITFIPDIRYKEKPVSIEKKLVG
jgi:hypothetical protein